MGQRRSKPVEYCLRHISVALSNVASLASCGKQPYGRAGDEVAFELGFGWHILCIYFTGAVSSRRGSYVPNRQ